MALHNDDSDVIKIHSFDGQTVWYDRQTALFEVGNFLGGGAAGNVYECEHVKSREHFALKILNPLGYKLLSSMILRKCNIVSKGEALNDVAEIDRVVVLGKHHVWWLINGGTKQFVAAYFSIKHNCLKEFSLNQCIHVWGSNPSEVNNDESGNKDEIVEAAVAQGASRIYVPAVPPKFADFVRKRNRIFREIQNMRKIRAHINVIRLEGVLELTQDSKCTIFLVMELANGGELFDRIKLDCGAREATAKLFFQQLLLGVMHCHNHGVCHRDLKPENLLLQDSNDNGTILKIADFGFSARFAMGDNEGAGNAHNDDWKGAMSMGNQMGMSRANALPFVPTHGTSMSLPDESLLRVLKSVVGSPFYVAPEVLQARGYDGPKADVWSLGVILYAMLAGNLPFEQELSSCKRFRLFCKWVREQTAKGLRFWNDQSVEYPQWLFPAKFSMLAKGLIVAMLHPDPDKRISVSEAMRHPLCTAVLSSSISQSQPQQATGTNNSNCHSLSSLPVAVAAAAPAAAPNAAIMQISEGAESISTTASMPIASAVHTAGVEVMPPSTSTAPRSGLSRSIEAINTTVARAVCVETAEEVVAMAIGSQQSTHPSVPASRNAGSAVVVVRGDEVKVDSGDPTVTLPPLSHSEEEVEEQEELEGGSPMELEQERQREDDAEVERYDLRGESREDAGGSLLDYGYGLTTTSAHENFCGDDDVMFYMEEDGLRVRSSSNSSFQQDVAAGGHHSHSPHVSFQRVSDDCGGGGGARASDRDEHHRGHFGSQSANDNSARMHACPRASDGAYSIPSGRPSLPFPNTGAGIAVGRYESAGPSFSANPVDVGPHAQMQSAGGNSLMHLAESPSGSTRGLSYSPQFEPPVAPMLFTSRSIDDLIATHDNAGDDDNYSPSGHNSIDDTSGHGGYDLHQRRGPGGGSSAHVPTFSDSVKRSTRFITAVPAAEVLSKIESILEQFRKERIQTPIGIIGKVEMYWEDYRLEVWGSDTSGPALCALQLYQLPAAASVSGTLLSEATSPARFFAMNPSPSNSNPPSPATFALSGSSKSCQGLPAPLSSLAQQGSPYIQINGGRASPLAFPFRNASYDGQGQGLPPPGSPSMFASSPPVIYSFGVNTGGPGQLQPTPQQQPLQQSQQLFLAEFVRGQLEIFAFKRFYQWVRQRLTEVVKRDYNFKLLDHGSTPTDTSFLMQRYAN